MHKKGLDYSMNLNTICYIGAIIGLPFTAFILSVPGLGNSISEWMLVIGMIHVAYEIIIKKESLIATEKMFLKYIFLGIIWSMICTIVGIIQFPYTEELTDALNQKVPHILQSIRYQGNDIFIDKLWLSINFVKRAVFGVIFSYGISLWGYHVYRGKKELLLNHTILAVQILTVICITYSMIEIGYLCGSSACRNIMMHINPLYMEIGTTHGWWPPLLWSNQVRSIFLEPSFLGIAGALVIPVLVMAFFRKGHLTSLILFFGFSILIFLSKARTATILYFFQMILLGGYFFFFQKMYRKKLAILLLTSLIAFGTSLTILPFYYNWQNSNTVRNDFSVQTYMDQNVASLENGKRSNSARYTNVRVTFKTALEHPIFGVGYGLKDVYIDRNLTDEDLKVGEVKLWSDTMHEQGFLKAGFPTLNGLSGVFIQYGILGLILYCIPMIVILYRFATYKTFYQSKEVVCMIIGLLGLLAALFSNVATISFYLEIGILLCLLFDSSDRCNNGNI